MDNVIKLKAEPLTDEGFTPYGKAILLPANPAPKKGDNWDCWFGFGSLAGEDSTIGIVLTRSSKGLIEHMEAHLHPEFLIPITGPIIQAVALPKENGIPGERPDINTVKAFIIEPGQSIIMGKGVWHYAAIPLNEKVWYYFLGNEIWDGPGTAEEPWIPFLENKKLEIIY